jgi:O-antigen ligase
MKYIERAYPWILLAPTLLPVVIWSSLIYPYLVPKTLLFYTISLVAVASFMILVAHEKPFFWSRLSHKETWIPAALLALAYTTSILGVNFYRSFWSLFVRGDGLLMLTCVVASFYLILLYADRTFFERFLRFIAIVASFVAIYGIGEWFLEGGRIGSLLGNADFFAGYLGITFFATLAAAKSLTKNWRNAARVGAGAQLIAILFTATRGTLLALLVAGLVTLIYTAWRSTGKQRMWLASILASLVVFGGLFFALRSELAKVPFAPIARVASISIADPDVASRLFIWKNMVGQIEQQFWLGNGTEHIDVLFNHFYDPTQISEQWFDRSHNAFLDYTAQYGIGGLLLYLALIASFFIAARRFAVRNERPFPGLFVLLAITYAVQNFFVFDTITSFWLLIALLAVYLSISFENTSPTVLSQPSWTRPLSWVAGVILLTLIIPVSVRPAIAAYDLAQAYKYQLTDVPKEVNSLSSGMALGTYGDLEYGYEAYDMYANNQVSAISGAAQVQAYQEALSILTIDFNRYTYDARTALYLAHILTLAPSGISIDNNLLSSALDRAISLSPKRAQPWYVLVNISLTQANTYPSGSIGRTNGYAAAEDILTKYIALVPTLAEPHFVLAELKWASGDTAGALAEAAMGKGYYQSDLETATRAAGLYENLKDWTDAKFFLTQVVQLDPSDMTSLYDLAKVTYLSGDPAGADTIVQQLRTTDPTILPTDQNFLAAITAYEQSKK